MYKLIETRSVDLDFGIAGLKSLEGGRIGNKEIEVVRKVLKKTMRKKGKIRVRLFPFKGLTKKAIAVRMGKGKGNVSRWVGEVRTGRVMYEIGGIPLIECENILREGQKRLPVKNRIVTYKT